MEHIVNLHIEKLPEGVYLASSDDIPGLVAQGRTVTETLEIARDVAKKLLEAQAERQGRSQQEYRARKGLRIRANLKGRKQSTLPLSKLHENVPNNS